MRSNWLTALDAFESHLDVQAKLVDEGRYDEVVAFLPPADLPTLPKVLVARALGLLDRAQALTNRAQALTDHAGELRDENTARLARPRPDGFSRHAVPAYVDQRA